MPAAMPFCATLGPPSLPVCICMPVMICVWVGWGGGCARNSFKSVGMRTHIHTHTAWAPIFTHSWGGHIELINDTNYNASLYWGMGFEEAPNCLKCLVWECGCVYVCMLMRRERQNASHLSIVRHRRALAGRSSDSAIPHCPEMIFPTRLIFCSYNIPHVFLHFNRWRIS